MEGVLEEVGALRGMDWEEAKERWLRALREAMSRQEAGPRATWEEYARKMGVDLSWYYPIADKLVEMLEGLWRAYVDVLTRHPEELMREEEE
jgi:hypothetical protein